MTAVQLTAVILWLGVTVYAVFGDILPGRLSLAALAPLQIVFIVAALVIGPSLALLFNLDQRSRLEGHGLGHHTPVSPGS